MQSFRHHSIRLPDYDYTQPGRYFITLVTERRIDYFGAIVAEKMHENSFGRLARKEWKNLSQRFSNVVLDEFVVMPNHIHGIIIILAVDTQNGITATSNETFGQPVPGSIPTIVRAYKAAVTRRARRMVNDPKIQIWQRNYYEHVIRNDRGLQAARLYVQENPMNWVRDQENQH
jgi:REP element-mobilizing transposase RayT